MKSRFIISKTKALDKLNYLKDLGVNVTYSWKTNPEVGKVLRDESDSMFSVHTIKELEEVEDYSNAWFFVLAQSVEELKDLIEVGVTNFVVDLRDDVDKVVEAAKGSKINLLLRMKLRENTIFTGKHYVWGLDAKIVNELISDLSGNECIDKLGVHVHRKTQNVSEWNLKEELNNALETENLSKISVINLGGGLPGKYKNTDDRAMQKIENAIKEVVEWFEGEVYVEPGRFIAAPAVDFECEVIAVQDRVAIVNASIFSGMMDTVVANVKLLVEGELEKGEIGKGWMIKGNSPDSADILRYEVFLNDEPKVGDVIKFANAGAYTYCTDMCGFEKPEVVVN